MSASILKIGISGFAFVIIFFTGLRIHAAGKPFPTGAFALHKLIALACVVFLIVIINKVHQATPLQNSQLAVVALAAVCVLVTLISGGLVSVPQPMPVLVQRIHLIAPLLSVITVGAALALVIAR